MLRNRSKAVASKQPLITDADHSSQSPPMQNHTKPTPSLFTSPSLKAFTLKILAEAEAVVTPTSVLDSTKSFSPFKNPFWCDMNQCKSPEVLSENQQSWDKLETRGIGVALIDEEASEMSSNSFSKPSKRIVLFGTSLRVQIPPPANCMLSPPADFGIKTRNYQLSASGSTNSGIQTNTSPGVLTDCIPMNEIELSEDYTCVMSYGPNPKTIHIFDNCVLENYCSLSDKSNAAPRSFLSLSHMQEESATEK
ncbi:hypothetical protein MANES_05G079800v8 [Manihot esculenta]|uniref:FLZ-type domain-containing protein n=1 Tax=Manihot esculenta TaxID=3983 RepID=A0A2C9VVQ8_MANES|nr:hypothetical protein MANES_05G079800v8 [Manihot esculenta]